MTTKGNIKFFWVKSLVSFLVIAFAVWLTYREMVNHHHALFDRSYWGRFTSIDVNFIGVHFLVLLLTFFNWGLEAVKWKIIVKDIQEINLWEAYKAVLTGLGVSFVSPRFIGESIGRVLHLSNSKRNKAIAGLMVSRISQLFVTVVIGLVCMLFFANVIEGQSGYYLVSTIVLTLIILAVLFRRKIIGLLVNRLPEKFVSYLDLLRDAPDKLLVEILGLSFVRYFVFLIQFLMIFSVLGVENNWLDLGIGMAVFFLVRSVFISVNLFLDYAVRVSSALIVLNTLIPNPGDIILTISIVWVFNVLIPSLLGSLFVRELKIKATS